MATSTLRTSLGVATLSSIQGLKGNAFMSRNLTAFMTKYGADGKALMSRCLESWVKPQESMVETEPFNFEDSVASRVVTVGTRVIWGILEFSLGILLSDEDIRQIKHILDVADRIFANTNDYFSWEVERDSGQRVQNTVKTVMDREGKSEQQAKEKLRAAILEDERKYQLLVKQFALSAIDVPADVRRFLVMLEVLLGGHHIWCAACERYKSRAPSAGNPSVRKEIIIPDRVEEPNEGPASSVALGNSALLDPVHYIQSLPSKNMRSKVIDALNIWFQLPHHLVDTVKGTVDDLHNSTLILDDIQDSSYLRRGFAATHHVFGSAQCINSATYLVAQAASRIIVHNQQHPSLITIFLEGLKELALGQSWDLNWKSTGYCPSTEEYMAMVDGKTGVMFDIIIRMMHCFSSSQTVPVPELNRLTRLLGRWYQVRDDYQNLQDEQYTAQKGLCEDLDEGKLSYPLTVCCNTDPKAQRIIMGILRQRLPGTPLLFNVKMQILDLIRRSGALQQTWELLQKFKKQADAALSNLEAITGVPNEDLRVVLTLLGNITAP
ncbi:fusicoccadiene synthase [Aspergillus udagawae]|nr:fusicoccadiene synthase [Aspergillus udagawae]